MNKFFTTKTALFLLLITLSSFMSLHKYYVGVTDVLYVPEEKSIQIISRLFIDDFEAVLQKRYTESLRLEDASKKEEIAKKIQQYYAKKMLIIIDDVPKKLKIIGFKFEDDMIISYFEINEIKSIKKLKITNKLLFENEQNQQNITHISIKSVKNSFLFVKGKATDTLIF